MLSHWLLVACEVYLSLVDVAVHFTPSLNISWFFISYYVITVWVVSNLLGSSIIDTFLEERESAAQEDIVLESDDFTQYKVTINKSRHNTTDMKKIHSQIYNKMQRVASHSIMRNDSNPPNSTMWPTSDRLSIDASSFSFRPSLVAIPRFDETMTSASSGYSAASVSHNLDLRPDSPVTQIVSDNHASSHTSRSDHIDKDSSVAPEKDFVEMEASFGTLPKTGPLASLSSTSNALEGRRVN